ncbi:MAG: hypothetical protein ACO3E9_02295 [Gemmataceae bacterium]
MTLINMTIMAMMVVISQPQASSPPKSISGVYPHLAMYNNEAECGTGAVVPWAGKLWVVTYAPHKPSGSTDKLYEIDANLGQTIRPESIGGTPANRMIHDESGQLFIGPYAIDSKANVRAISYEKMFGRPTGNARHLTDPAGKIYYATMEEGLYEVDVKTLAVTELWADEQRKTGRHSNLPGYHGKGLYSGFGRIIYANNGDHAREALSNPKVPSGVLASWDGNADAWNIVRRNQFTEVTGPGGIHGNKKPDSNPVWSIGWDHRSLILMMLDGNQWHSFRLPKASHSYDGAHGWNTEWPRIREIGNKDGSLLMTMHGMFWNFPAGFSAANTSGIAPRSAYLKVIGDFCNWNGQLVFGCDDTAKSEFLNKRKAKGNIEGPGQSHSNLWFTSPDLPDHLGPTLASGALLLEEPVKAGVATDPFLFHGWQRRSMHLVNHGNHSVAMQIEADEKGDGTWRPWDEILLQPGSVVWKEFPAQKIVQWLRIKPLQNAQKVSVHFAFSNPEKRPTRSDSVFEGLATISEKQITGGLVRARGENKRTLQLLPQMITDEKLTDLPGLELDATLKLESIRDENANSWLKGRVAIPKNAVTVEPTSVLVVDDRGRRWRLPKNNPAYEQPIQDGLLRVCREVATERDLFSMHGTFYELPAENADGFAKIRPISSHDFRIMDYCSYRGMLVMTGLKLDAKASNNVVKSADGKAGLWLGVIDDLWKLGKPTGTGGPWLKQDVKANQPSDPYLLWGYDRRTLNLQNHSMENNTFKVQIDLTGEGLWVDHRQFEVAPNASVQHIFPEALQARWLRLIAGSDCQASAQLEYK